MGALQQAVEVVAVDAYFVLYGGESVGMAYGVGQEGGVARMGGHVALIA